VAPRVDGALVDVFDGYGESVSEPNSGIDCAETAFTKDVVDTVRLTEFARIQKSHLMWTCR